LRTALDLACGQSRRRALAALDAFMRTYGLTHEEMQRELTRYFRRRGVVQARQLVPVANPLAESPGESWVRMDIVDRGLPLPRLQWWVQRHGHDLYRLDMAFPKHRVAVEYDGREFHDDVVRRRRDEVRRTWLRSQGWTVIVITKHDFTPEAVDRWVGEILEALGRAA
jgi:hypothetical protein